MSPRTPPPGVPPHASPRPHPPAPLRPPAGFRGTWCTGEDATRLAGRISGPFEGAPVAWAEPTDLADLVRLVRHAADAGVPLVPRGGGTGMPGGNLAAGIVVALGAGGTDAPVDASSPLTEPTRNPAPAPGPAPASTEGFLHEGALEIDRDGGRRGDGDTARIRVGAGVTAARVEQLAAAAGFMFPPLPSSARWATIGGMTANNAAGARSFRYGAMARWVEGVEGVTVSGDPIRLDPGSGLPGAVSSVLPGALPSRWPEVRKNSSGYGLDRWLRTGDPAQLAVGSEGTLLVVSHVTLRLTRRPPHRGVCLLPVHTPDQAGALAVAADELGATACEFLGRRLLDMTGLDGDPELGSLSRGALALFLLEFEGWDTSQVAEALGRAGDRGREIGGSAGLATTDPVLANRLWGLRHRASPLIAAMAGKGLYSTQFVEDSVVPPARLGAYLEGVDRILREEGLGMDAVVFGHAGDGNVHLNPLVDTDDAAWRDRVRAILDAVVELVVDLGGTLAGEHGDGRLRAPFIETVWGREAVASFRALKEAFDPDGLLNPGVILPSPGQDPLQGLRPRPRSWPG
ncbi:MAG: FAD-binding oxidoreductase [Gemmatimonadales bacterium]|nr:MAG: FAD-binding oxidoreductase [Gemmatimonadales bacterium]